MWILPWHLCLCIFLNPYNCGKFQLIKRKRWWWQRWPLRKAFDWRQTKESNIYQSLIPGLLKQIENVIYQDMPQCQTTHSIIMDFSAKTVLPEMQVFLDIWFFLLNYVMQAIPKLCMLFKQFLNSIITQYWLRDF